MLAVYVFFRFFTNVIFHKFFQHFEERRWWRAADGADDMIRRHRKGNATEMGDGSASASRSAGYSPAGVDSAAGILQRVQILQQVLILVQQSIFLRVSIV